MSIDRTQLEKFLRKTEYFGDCTAEELNPVIERLDLVSVEADTTVCEEGAQGSAWYLVIDGEVAVFKNAAAGAPPHLLCSLGPGEGFGEMALIDSAPRMAAVIATSPLVLARLTRQGFDELIYRNHPAAVQLLRSMAGVLCERLRELTIILQDLSDDPGPQPQLSQEVLSTLFKLRLLSDKVGPDDSPHSGPSENGSD